MKIPTRRAISYRIKESGSDPTATYHPNSDGNAKFKHSLWPHAWYCIRKANIGIANLERLTEATDEEKKLIAGQLYFFRAWWHFEMMQYFGGLPYIDTVLSATEKMSLPRLSYQDVQISSSRFPYGSGFASY